ncbi:hypothetical protein [Pseudomonas phage Astolliot]|nr:hypothetical protein [Pseudomonas phage Astolliot]
MIFSNLNKGIQVKYSKSLEALRDTLSKTPGNAKIKVKPDDIRELITVNAFHSSVALAAVSILGSLADKNPLAFADKANVDLLIQSMQNNITASDVNAGDAIKFMVEMAVHYTKG